MEEKGRYVWIEDENYSWLPAKIVDIEDDQYKFLIKIDGTEMIKHDDKDKDYHEVHPSCLKGVDDLLWLGDFNQQTLLHNTRERFAQDKIYSFIGMPILIAVNPYKNLKIYTDEDINYFKKYFFQMKRNPNDVKDPTPHLYHIAEAAYQDMITEKKNQSIIISGESGSGKTQSTKIILKYLAVSSLTSTESSHNNNDSNQISVEKQVLDSNPLLEAFGNAKTVRNNNSSRFGKFINVNFTEHGRILSARIYNYLLEKTRVVSIHPDERNYHIFYQLIKGADENERKTHHIKDIEHFNFLNTGCFEVDETDDKANFLETKECMQKLNFKPEEMTYIFNILMGILYLGNIDFIDDEKDNNIISDIDPISLSDFNYASEMIGVSEEKLKNILTIKKFKDPVSGNPINRYLTREKSYNCRDALAKVLYSRMFDYIVNKINAAIANKKEVEKVNKDKLRKIGILDIFGFENFETNSFEQLCINYANERLQQFFNNHIFKLEQEEYKKEGIDWSQVEFTDNKDILELIDESKLSIFTLLDSEAITPNSSDDSFKKKVYQYLKKNKSLADDEGEWITINHYAGMVYYYIYGFVEKNMDQLTPDILEALEKSKNRLVKKIFGKKEEDVKKPIQNKMSSDSLSKQFKKQLDELMKMLSTSNPRYVKCIKPNAVKKPQILESHDVMEQLLSAGVLEAIKIRKQGYSIRRTQEEFVKRYHPLTPQIDLNYYENIKDFKEALEEMIKLLEHNPDIQPYLDKNAKLLQIGISKVFMKEEVKAMLESKLSRIRYILRIQSTHRAVKVYKRVWKYLKSVKKIQARWRGNEMRIFVVMLRLTIKIQKKIRFFFYKKTIYKNLHRLAMENIKLKEEERLRILKEQKELQRQKEEELRRIHEEEMRNNQKEELNNLNQYSQINQYGSEKDNLGNSIDIENKNVKKITRKKSQTNSKNQFMKTGRESSVSLKESLGDISTTDLQLCNDLVGITRKAMGKKNTKNTFTDLLQTNLDSAHEEMKQKLELMTEELGQYKKVKEDLQNELNHQKEETLRKEKEIESLKNTADANTLQAQLDNFNSNVDKLNIDLNMTKKSIQMESSHHVQCDHIDELRRLKKELAEKEGFEDIFNLKIDELSKSNHDLQSLNESLKDQLHKRTDKMNKEMTILYQQIKDLEIKKGEYERQNKTLIEEKQKEPENKNDISLTKTTIIKPDNKYQELKSENKILNKKIEEIKSKYEKEIHNLRNDLIIKETKIKESEVTLNKIENELRLKSESYHSVKVEYDLCKEKIQDMKVKLENLNKNSKLQEYEQEIVKMKNEFETNVRKKDSELEELKESLDMNANQIERLKKMEKALKNELNSKNDEMNRRQEMLKEVNEEIDKLNDDNMQMKKENYSLSSKLEILESEYKNKFENENRIRQQELKNLNEKEMKYEKMILDMKEVFKKKQRIIENKKKMNLLLVDLAKIKKGEVQCIESLHLTNSTTLKETLNKIRENEKEILSRLAQISSNPDNTDSEEDYEEESENEGSDFEEDYEDN